MELPPKQPPMFTEAEPPREFPTTAVAIAAVAVTILAVVLVILGRRPAAPVAGMSAAYAPQLELTGEQMSEADSRDGFGKLIYIEGHIVNRGAAVVTAVRVQVVFPSDQGPAQSETVPVNTIIMRQPYVDVRAISPTAPLAPGAGADFRLIFDDVKDSWNQQMPQLAVTGVATR